MRNIKNNLTMLSTFLSGVVGHHYIGKILDYRNDMAASKEMELQAISDKENMEIIQNKLNLIIRNNENLSKNVETLIDKHVPESQLSNANELLEYGYFHCKTVREILDLGPDNINLDFYQASYRAAVACEKANREASECIKNLLDSINGNNNIISDFNLKNFYEYLNKLSLLELSALFHILVLITIGFLVFNILSTILGNEIINYFKLEEKYPKLAAFLRLRIKFQKYYLTLSFSFLFLIIFASIQINLLVLF